MKIYVGVTDNAWFDVVSSLSGIDEVNFWQPSGEGSFRALQPGEPFLFKLHSPLNFIVGGGFFAHWTRLPISLAWEAFGEKNGAHTFQEMRGQILRYRRPDENRQLDFQIGCILIEQPFFLEKNKWLPVPPDWRPNIVQGKGYDLNDEPGKSLWEQIKLLLSEKPGFLYTDSRIDKEVGDEARYGAETLVRPRLGQGSFRILVTDAYKRSCAITEEHALPVLEAAHIKPFSEHGPRRVYNGLLLRSDVHRLFDRGYITVTPDYRVEVSRRLREEFDNGRYYYPFHGNTLCNLPKDREEWPLKNLLVWHNENIFKS